MNHAGVSPPVNAQPQSWAFFLVISPLTHQDKG